MPLWILNYFQMQLMPSKVITFELANLPVHKFFSAIFASKTMSAYTVQNTTLRLPLDWVLTTLHIYLFTAGAIKSLHFATGNFFIFNIRTLWRQSAQISKSKNGGLDQYGAGPFKQQQFGTAGTVGVKCIVSKLCILIIFLRNTSCLFRVTVINCLSVSSICKTFSFSRCL